MKKIIFLFLILVLVTGCSIQRLDYSDVSKTVELVLSKTNNVTNTNSKGYSYYLPKGIRRAEVQDYNEILYSDGNTYYLYVDVIAYKNKVEPKFKVNKNSYYSKALDINGKKGYIEITRKDRNYFIEILYNYSKIEAIVKESNINKVLIDSAYILSTIRYNKVIIDATLEEAQYVGKEELFNLFEPQRAEGNFLDYVNEYDEYNSKENEVKDEDVLIFEENQNEVIGEVE